MIHTISKPKEPSTMSNTRSAISPMSIMLLRSLHSTKVQKCVVFLAADYCDWYSKSVCMMSDRTFEQGSSSFTNTWRTNEGKR